MGSDWTTLGLAQPKAGCTSWVHTVQAPGCSARALSQVDPAFHVLPRSKLRGSQVLLRGADSAGLCILYPSQVLAAQVTRCLASALSQVGWASYSPPLSQPLSFPGVQQELNPRCAVCLLWGADLGLWHSRQMWTIQDPRKMCSNWEPAHSLVEDVVSGAEIAAAPCLPALMSNACLSASREGWPYMGVGLLSLAICLILCSGSTPRVTMPGGVRAFHGNSLLFIYLFIVSLVILQFGLLSHISPLILSSVR